MSQKRPSPITSKPETQKCGVSSEIKGYDEADYSYLPQTLPNFSCSFIFSCKNYLEPAVSPGVWEGETPNPKSVLTEHGKAAAGFAHLLTPSVFRYYRKVMTLTKGVSSSN